MRSAVVAGLLSCLLPVASVFAQAPPASSFYPQVGAADGQYRAAGTDPAPGHGSQFGMVGAYDPPGQGTPTALAEATPPAPSDLPVPPPGTPALPPPALPPAAAPAELPAPKPAQDEYYSLDELRGEMKKLAWTKGDYKVVPYGILWGSMVYENGRTSPGPYTLYALPHRPNTNGEFFIDARSTRLGLDVGGPNIPLFSALSGGKVEFDFQRSIDTENRAAVLLRHAYVEVKNDEYRLLFGQTWDVISPLYPGMVMYSVGWGGGNIGYRRAQLRGERYYDVSDLLLITAQGSANSDVIWDTSADWTGRAAGWPVFEGRLAVTLGRRGKDCRPIEFGVSSHVGEQDFDFLTNPYKGTGVPRRTWSLNADIKIPITDRLGVQAEFFTGENLSAYFGGILQGIDVGTHETICSNGGWIEGWYDWTPKWHTHLGYSIDDPVNADVTRGRTYNAFVFANLVYDVSAKFLVGLEFSSWKTNWLGAPAGTGPQGDSQRLEFVAKYAF